MFKFVSFFSKICLALVVLGVGYWGYGQWTGVESLASGKGYCIVAQEASAEKDVRWTQYLYDHLKNRAEREELVVLEDKGKDRNKIVVHLDPALPKDFELRYRKREIRLVAREDKVMLWLQYQIMKIIGEEDARVAVSDLPPAILRLKDTTGNFAFEYRDVYTPTTQDSDYTAILGLDDINQTWGIWGHNLPKVVGKNVSSDVYATIDGEKNDEQYCFSSDELYRGIEEYIADNFGTESGRTIRFLIAPNDNELVCTCPLCLAAGNTAENATPAVSRMISRLAGRFPGYVFFTSAYQTTLQPPKERLPKNVGVVVSAMNFPFRFDTEGGASSKRFATLLKDWKAKTDRVYVWDYINNFDDYLTPFPVLKIAQRRLQFYQRYGVTGVFFNGSGYDYSSFEDINTVGLAALLISPNADVESLIYRYLKQNYPMAVSALYPFYMGLENRAVSCKKALNLYGGVKDAVNTYLDAAEFVKFYSQLEQLVTLAKEDERKNLNRLLVALTFTRLEIARIQGFQEYGCFQRQDTKLIVKPEILKWLERLEGNKAIGNMQSYNEVGIKLTDYIRAWRNDILKPEPAENLWLGQRLRALSKLDEDYTDLSVLTDGVHGLTEDYHCGWLINSLDDLQLVLPTEHIRKTCKFNMTFLHMPRHKIAVPQRVELYKNGKLYKTFPVNTLNDNKRLAVAFGKVDFTDVKEVLVKVVRPENRKIHVAIDEIQLIRE